MHQQEVLELVGRSALWAYRNQAVWVHRRVESVTFPARNDPIVRRHVSIDFSIPEGLAAINGDADERPEDELYYYVPVSVLQKWPPVLQLDLRNAQDEAIPLLTRDQNAVTDGALLLALASDLTAGSRQLADSDIPRHLKTIASRPGDEAREALTAIIPPDPRHDDGLQSALRGSAEFLDLAGGLVDNTLLWLRVCGGRNERTIVKFAYDVARELDVTTWDRAAFGIAPLEARVETPHIGSAGSYHLAVVSPAPLDIVDAQLTLSRRATPLHNVDEGDVIARCTAQQSRELEGPFQPDLEDRDLRLYADAAGRQARFYIAGRRDGCFGRLRISIAVQKSGFLQGAALASTLIALLLLAYAIGFGTIVEKPERVTPVLLLVPGLLAYLVVRPRDHELARDFLAGTRRLLLLSGLLPIINAASLAVGGDATWVDATAWVSSGVAVALALVLWLGALLPRGSRRMPLSSSS